MPSADIAVEERPEVIRVTEQIGRSQNRPRRNLVRNVLRGDIAHFKIVALQGDEFGTLLEEIAAEIGLDGREVSDLRAQQAHHFGADILLGKHCRETQRRLVLRQNGECCGQQNATNHEGAARKRKSHLSVLP
jgi:hypothetical protein